MLRRFLVTGVASAALLVLSFGLGPFGGSSGAVPSLPMASAVIQTTPVYADGPVYGFQTVASAIQDAEDILATLTTGMGPLWTDLTTAGWTYTPEEDWVCCYAEE